MALTKVRGKGLGTLGDGTASDNSIVFDGNAQDFHIGLDDSEDKLTIGLGSTLGTTSHMTFDSTGAILKPLQPAFLARPASQQDNLAINSTVEIAFGSEIFDQNGDFASNTFTAPVTGKYMLSVDIYLLNADIDTIYYQPILTTSNRTYKAIISSNWYDTDLAYTTIGMSVLTDMDANDTAVVSLQQSGGAAQADIHVNSYFSGFLVC